MKKVFRIILCIGFLLGLLTACSQNQIDPTKEAPTTIETFEDLNGKRVGLVTGTLSSVIVPKLIPDANYQSFNSIPDLVVAINNNKIDSFCADEAVFVAMLWEGNDFKRIEEAVSISHVGFLFNKENTELKNEFNAYLKVAKENGTIQALEDKWFSGKEPNEFMNYDHLTGENGTLHLGLCSSTKPFTYIKNGQFTGFDVEVLIGFCEASGYDLDIEDGLFGGVLSGVASNTYDIGASGFTITDERKESVDFSDVYHSEDIVMVIKDDLNRKTMADYKYSKIGVHQGSYVATIIYDLFPEAEITEYLTNADSLVALQSGKIDLLPNDASIIPALKWEGLKVDRLDEVIDSSPYGFILPKDGDPKLLEQLNSFILELGENGTLALLEERWTGDHEPTEFERYNNLEDINGTLSIGTCVEAKPFVYQKEDFFVGMDIDILTLFAKEYGYALEFENVTIPSVLAGVTTHKYDIGASGLTITDERKESVNFSEPYHIEDVVLIIMEEGALEDGRFGITNFIDSIHDSFDKTFIREDRYKLIIEGVVTTLLISISAVVGGTLLGFMLYMLKRSRNAFISKATELFTNVYSSIIAGTPTLVILMILFYVVFTSKDMSGVVVAIIGFIFTFGSFVYGLLEVSVQSVSLGQSEAAYALGYSYHQTFFKIVLPQSMKMFLPSYSGEIVSLIKATSVVGYIAVNDLTKVGDIIRGNTYEAFFPLISIAVIYFMITWLIRRLLKYVQKSFDPKQRKNKDILKGVKR